MMSILEASKDATMDMLTSAAATMVDTTYHEYVSYLSQRYPSLAILASRLSADRLVAPSRAFCLEWSSTRTSSEYLNSEKLHQLIINIGQRVNPPNLNGRLLLVEDPTPGDMEMLGSALDIDPFFFASYIGSSRLRYDFESPSNATLLSEQITRDFVALEYNHSICFTSTPPAELTTYANVTRKVTMPPRIRGTWHVGIVRGCCSVLRLRTSPWLCLILVDRAPSSFALKSPGVSGVHPILTPIRLTTWDFLGGPDDFECPERFSKFHRLPGQSLGRSGAMKGWLDELVHHWQCDPKGFNPARPTMLSLMCYPVKKFTTEWLCYRSTMSRYVRIYEYGPQELQPKLKDPWLFDEHIYDLQNWRRRVAESVHKLKIVQEFLQHWKAETDDADVIETANLVTKDLEYVSSDIRQYGQQLANTIPLLTNLVEILDSKQSMAESANVKQLTLIALVFVPLSYIASLFSMNDRHGPGGDKFWVYFAVAVPVSLIVLAIARLPFTKAKSVTRLWVKKLNPKT